MEAVRFHPGEPFTVRFDNVRVFDGARDALVNTNFDSFLYGWNQLGGLPGQVARVPADAAGANTSGSVRVISSQVGAPDVDAQQYILVKANEAYSLSAANQILPSPRAGRAQIVLDWFLDPGCTDFALGRLETAAINTTKSRTTWSRVSDSVRAPDEAQSVMIRLRAHTDPVDNPDGMELDLFATLFDDVLFLQRRASVPVVARD